MKIIFAQGNPSSQYQLTRHNVGFMALDHIAKQWGGEFASKPKFHADIAEVSVNGEKVLLVKPTTFYNETGQAARQLIDFYKLTPEDDFLVIHDELALPLGVLRTRSSGSDAGNNGIKSLNAHLDPTYRRIRIGVYNELRNRMHDADFVLGTFSAEERKLLPDLFTKAEQFCLDFINGSFVNTKVTI